ncbi:MAG: cell wall hydrolase [Peptococcaceae bacterium]|nr:cell wall hydrolase [Pelotomaculum propionicicum]NLI13217.1 cell wall hydrolase [Peptococcaceae bacterium]
MWNKMLQLKKEIGILAGMLLMALALFLHLAPAAKKMPLLQEKQQAVIAAEETNEPVSAGEREISVSRGDNIDRQSVYILAQVIEGEAADEPYEGKVAVGAVIINRTQSPDFPHTIPGVINQMGAFESVSNGQSQRPLSSESLNAAVDAMNGKDPSGGALYFWNPSKSTSSWVWSRPVVTQIGRHVFAM